MIIVTGGTGFIGSNLVAGLEEAGYQDIVICDRLGTEEKWKNIAGRELRDIVHPDWLFDYLDTHREAIEIIFHMGAISSTTEQDVDLITQINIVLSRRLWKWCGVNQKRFIYASSAATYGDGSQGFDDFETVTDLARLLPLNAYGWSKHVFDRRVARVLEDQREAVPPQWAGLKFFNVYGPNEYHKGDQRSVVCKLYPQVEAGAAAKLFKSHHKEYEDGGQVRDFIYVKDCVSVMLWLLDNPSVNGLFNVGTGQARSFKDLARATFEAAGREPKITYIDMPEILQDKYQYFTQANVQKLRDRGYAKPFTSLENGIAEYVQKYLGQDEKFV